MTGLGDDRGDEPNDKACPGQAVQGLLPGQAGERDARTGDGNPDRNLGGRVTQHDDNNRATRHSWNDSSVPSPTNHRPGLAEERGATRDPGRAPTESGVRRGPVLVGVVELAYGDSNNPAPGDVLGHPGAGTRDQIAESEILPDDASTPEGVPQVVVLERRPRNPTARPTCTRGKPVKHWAQRATWEGPLEGVRHTTSPISDPIRITRLLATCLVCLES